MEAALMEELVVLLMEDKVDELNPNSNTTLSDLLMNDNYWLDDHVNYFLHHDDQFTSVPSNPNAGFGNRFQYPNQTLNNPPSIFEDYDHIQFLLDQPNDQQDSFQHVTLPPTHEYQEPQQPEPEIEKLVVEVGQSQKRKPNDDEDHEDQDIQEEEEEDEEDGVERSADGSILVSKNLVSERKRRKRLNNQLFTLRSIVPNITKMDKRSVLVDALAYLRNIIHEIEIETEKKNSSPSLPSPSLSSSSSSETIHHSVLTTIVPCEPSPALPTISKVEAEKLVEDRFLLKIEFNKTVGGASQIQRSIETLGLEITNVSISGLDKDTFQSSIFLRVKKKGTMMTEEILLRRLEKSTKQLGFLLPSDMCIVNQEV